MLKMPICEVRTHKQDHSYCSLASAEIVQARPAVYFLRPEVFFQNHDLVLLFFNYI